MLFAQYSAAVKIRIATIVPCAVRLPKKTAASAVHPVPALILGTKADKRNAIIQPAIAPPAAAMHQLIFFHL